MNMFKWVSLYIIFTICQLLMAHYVLDREIKFYDFMNGAVLLVIFNYNAVSTFFKSKLNKN